jgi:hypothetical protein
MGVRCVFNAHDMHMFCTFVQHAMPLGAQPPPATRACIRRLMELKTARLTLLIDPAKKAAFEQLCAQQDRTPSQVVRQMIREYLAAHGVSYTPSGAGPRPKRAKAAGHAPAPPRGRKR